MNMAISAGENENRSGSLRCFLATPSAELHWSQMIVAGKRPERPNMESCE